MYCVGVTPYFFWKHLLKYLGLRKPTLELIWEILILLIPSGEREGGALKKCPVDNFSERASWRDGNGITFGFPYQLHTLQ